MRTIHWLTSSVFGVLLAGYAAAQTTPSQEERQALTPTGKLRVCFLSSSPVHVTRDQVSGESRGVAIDIGNELARRLGAPSEWVGYRTPTEIESSAQSDQWDVCVFAVTPARSKLMDFSPPLMEVEVGYLVPAGSSLASLSDVDQPGIRIAVQAKTVTDTHLSTSVKSASLLRVPSPTDPIDLVASGNADAFAHLKPFLALSSGRLPGSRILDGKIFSDQIAIAVPKRRSAGLDYVRVFVADAKSSGFIKSSIERAGLRAVAVAP
jgi:polar amino acid transport system substrate-binding protein